MVTLGSLDIIAQQTKSLANSQIRFEENKGQVHDQFYNSRPDVLYTGEQSGMTFHLRRDGISYQLYKYVDSPSNQQEPNFELDMNKDSVGIYRIDLNWISNNQNFQVLTRDKYPDYKNYYLPVCEEGVRDVGSYNEITFKNVFNGIDVRWYEREGNLEYDFIVYPKANYKAISWEIQGATSLSIDKKGRLIVETPYGEIREDPPYAYQNDHEIKSSWRLDGNRIGFNLEQFDDSDTVVIDPVVRVWSTYYGGSGNEDGYSCKLYGNNTIYYSGRTASGNNIATTGAHQTWLAGSWDSFLTKFDTDGNRIWATYIGGTGYEFPIGLDVDNQGVYISGVSSSPTGIATTGSHQDSMMGFYDGFIVKFNHSGTRLWGTYYGGSSGDEIKGSKANGNSGLYVTGRTNSPNNIATTGAYQDSLANSTDAFLSYFNRNGVLIWGTYFGGTGTDHAEDVALGSSGVLICGYTQSQSGISTTGSHQPTFSGGNSDGFLTKFSNTGSRLWSTYYGGSGNDQSTSAAVDPSNNIYLIGMTNSTNNIATSSAFQTSFGGGTQDVYLAKFNSSGTRNWSTYYGGNSYDLSFCVDLDGAANVYIMGYTNSTNNIATVNGYQTNLGGGADDFISRFDTSGNLKFGTYYGGTGYEGYLYGHNIQIDSDTNIYTASRSTSTSKMTTLSAHQVIHGGGTGDALFAKFYRCDTDSVAISVLTCDSFVSPSQSFIWKKSGYYVDTLVNYYGCDSVIHIYLEIANNDSAVEVMQCTPLTSPSGKYIYDSSGVYSDTLENAKGCDSVVTINFNMEGHD